MRLIRSSLLSVLLGTCVVPALGFSAAQAQIVISVGLPPPPLPVYVQPPIPQPGYIWTPGYWAYDDGDHPVRAHGETVGPGQRHAVLVDRDLPVPSEVGRRLARTGGGIHIGREAARRLRAR